MQAPPIHSRGSIFIFLLFIGAITVYGFVLTVGARVYLLATIAVIWFSRLHIFMG